MKKAFPKADAAQLDALHDLVTFEMLTKLETRLAERRVRVGIINALARCKNDAGCIAKNTSGISREAIEKVRKEFENRTKDLEAADRMGNFEIQRLLSAYNEADKGASTVMKKQADTIASVLAKI